MNSLNAAIQPGVEDRPTLQDRPINREPYSRHVPELWDLPQGKVDGVDIEELPIWCCWKVKPPSKAGDKPGKVPVSPLTGKTSGWSIKDEAGNAHSNLGGFFTTADAALEYANKHSNIAGIGIAANRKYRIAGGDPDHSRDPETGEMSEKAMEILEAANTYAEVSPGQSGYRFLFIGSFGGYVGNRDDVEFYEESRFLTITGDRVPGASVNLEERDLTELGRKHFGETAQTKKPNPPKRGEGAPETVPVDAGDAPEIPEGLKQHVREWIESGIADPSLDRSNCFFGICKDLIRIGTKPETVLDIVTHPSHGSSVVALDHSNGTHSDARRWAWQYSVMPAKEKVEQELASGDVDQVPTFEELMGEAQTLNNSSNPSIVTKLAEATAQLDTVSAGMVLKALKESTGLNMGDLKPIASAARRKKRPFTPVSGAGIMRMPPQAFPDVVVDSEGEPEKVLQTIPNVAKLLEFYGIHTAYNTIKKKTRIVIPSASGSPDNADNSALTSVISLAKLNELPTDQVPAYVEQIADENQYNPVVEWITSKPWDGQDRLQPLYETLTVSEDYPPQLRAVLIRRWLISAVAAVMLPRGFHSRGVLVLQGPQSIGKTSWLKRLVGDPQLCEDCVLVDHNLDPANKDSVLEAITHWLVELGELEGTFRKADIARLKGFITSNMDKVRRPYARLSSEYQRRTVFFASVNDSQFLVDDTGNSRFWTISVDAINYTHDIDTQQLWAQVAELYQQGEQWWLTPQEEAALDDINQGHRTASSIREMIHTRLDWDARGPTWVYKTASEVLVAIGYDKPTNMQAKEAGAALKEMKCTTKKSKGYTRYLVPSGTFVALDFDTEK